VSSKGFTRNVMINSGFVSREISINGKGNFDGSIGEQFSFDGIFVVLESVSRLSVSFVIIIRIFPSSSAFLFTFWGINGSGAGFEGSFNVMVTGLKGIGFAPAGNVV
jgi:hypothetical protein